jgi:hypothetical protein
MPPCTGRTPTAPSRRPAAIRAEIASNEAALARMHASQCKPCEIQSAEQHIDRLEEQLLRADAEKNDGAII